MISPRLRELLNRENVDYEVIVHPRRYTALETAAAEHVSGNQIAKVVMLKASGNNVMLVLPATRWVDLLKLSAFLGIDDVRIENEVEFERLFPDCAPGAMPPFGRLYNIPTYLDESLLDPIEIYFNGGTHTETVKMRSADFRRIADAEIGDFSTVSHLAV